MSEWHWWYLAGGSLAGTIIGLWVDGWLERRRKRQQHAEFVERAATRHLAWRARTVECPQCEGRGRVEREGQGDE